MDEVEEGRLEQRLRRSVAGHQPAAPEWLVGFIETVPARHRTAGRLALAFDRPRVRRGALATVVVAAALLAIVGSATLVAVRNGQNAEAGHAVTRENLMSDVWDEHWSGSTKTLDMHVSSLRRKLAEHGEDPNRIVTLRGFGYRYDPVPAARVGPGRTS